MANISFTLSVETTQARAFVTVSNIKNVDAKFRVKVTCYKYPNGVKDAKTVTSGECAKTLTTKKMEISGLTTGTKYIFSAKVYTSSKETFKHTIKTTQEMVGTLEVAESNPSAILIKLTGISPFNYDMETVFRYKKNDGTSEIKDMYTYSIPHHTRAVPQYSFSNLKQNTEYTFYADVYNIVNGKKSLNRSFSLVASTPRYTPGYVPHVYVDKTLVVPYTGKGLIWLKKDQDFGTDYGLIKYVSTDGGETYGNREVVTILPLMISGEVGSTKHYKFCVVDASSTEHNEVVEEVTFPALPFTERTAGDPVDITASEVRLLAEAALRCCEYWKHFTDFSRADDAYKALGYALSELEEGDLIEGGASAILNCIYEIVDAMLNADAHSIDESGDILTASGYNGLYTYLTDWLERI